MAIGTILQGETPWETVWNGVQGRFMNLDTQWNPLLDDRLPRLIVLCCTGASLAVSGAVMQSLFHNPLASPSVLGISSGGCLAVILTFILEFRFNYPYAIPLAAFLGCFLTLCLVYGFSRLQSGHHLSNLILTGIAVATILTAIQGFVLYLLRNQWQLIQTITEWEVGSTADRNWQHVHMQLPLTLIGLLGCWIYRKEINILALGEEEALNLGVDASKVRWRLFLCIALLTGGSLAALGMIPFFGLILPHILRKLQGSNHETLLTLCMVAGGATLTGIDLFLRLLQLHELSVGNFSAIVGGVCFLFLLFRSPRSIYT